MRRVGPREQDRPPVAGYRETGSGVAEIGGPRGSAGVSPGQCNPEIHCLGQPVPDSRHRRRRGRWPTGNTPARSARFGSSVLQRYLPQRPGRLTHCRAFDVVTDTRRLSIPAPSTQACARPLWPYRPRPEFSR